MVFFLFGDTFHDVDFGPDFRASQMPLIHIGRKHGILISVNILVCWLVSGRVHQRQPNINNVCAEAVTSGVDRELCCFPQIY